MTEFCFISYTSIYQNCKALNVPWEPLGVPEDKNWVGGKKKKNKAKQRYEYGQNYPPVLDYEMASSKMKITK